MKKQCRLICWRVTGGHPWIEWPLKVCEEMTLKLTLESQETTTQARASREATLGCGKSEKKFPRVGTSSTSSGNHEKLSLTSAEEPRKDSQTSAVLYCFVDGENGFKFY